MFEPFNILQEGSALVSPLELWEEEVDFDPGEPVKHGCKYLVLEPFCACMQVYIHLLRCTSLWGKFIIVKGKRALLLN